SRADGQQDNGLLFGQSFKLAGVQVIPPDGIFHTCSSSVISLPPPRGRRQVKMMNSVDKNLQRGRQLAAGGVQNLAVIVHAARAAAVEVDSVGAAERQHGLLE